MLRFVDTAVSARRKSLVYGHEQPLSPPTSSLRPQGLEPGTPRIDYSENYNPSKGTYFKGVYDEDGNYADLD